MAQAAVGAEVDVVPVVVDDVVLVVVTAKHEQALEMRAYMGPLSLSLHASTAYVGIAVGATLVVVKEEQKV